MINSVIKDIVLIIKINISHILVESSGRPLAICTTSAKGEEKEQVAPLLEKIKTLVDKAWKRGKVPVLEADKGYDAKRV